MGLLARILPVVNRFASCKSQPPWLDHIWNTDSGPHPLFSQKSSWKIKNELPGQRSAARFGFAPTFDDATRYEYPRCHHQKAQKQTNQNSRTRTAHETTGPQYRRLGPLGYADDGTGGLHTGLHTILFQKNKPQNSKKRNFPNGIPAKLRPQVP